MDSLCTLQVDTEGKIALPDAIRDRYGLYRDVSVRVIETRTGIFLLPLTDAPMSEALARELAEWQGLSAESLMDFPFEDKAEDEVP